MTKPCLGDRGIRDGLELAGAHPWPLLLKSGTGGVVSAPDEFSGGGGSGLDSLWRPLNLVLSSPFLTPQPGNLSLSVPQPPPGIDGNSNAAGSSLCKLELRVAESGSRRFGGSR